jgi:hypothetical protein
MATQWGAAWMTLAVTGFQQVRIPLASGARLVKSSSVPVLETNTPVSTRARMAFSIFKSFQT